MSYWIREVAGWLLVLFGLLSFVVVYEYCARRWIFEAGILAVISIFLFWGGISLLKVAVAARVCQQALSEFDEKSGKSRREARKETRV